MPANLALTQLDQTGRIHVLVDQLVAATKLADDPRASSQSPSYSRRAWVAAPDQAIVRFVPQGRPAFRAPPDPGPGLEGELGGLASARAPDGAARSTVP